MGISTHESPNEGATNVWLTPRHVILALGPFDLDPCAATVRPFDCAARNLTIEDDGLTAFWAPFEFVWCNPPYGPHAGKWLNRMIVHGNGVALVFARTETRATQPALKACDAVRFLEGRLTFLRPDGSPGVGNSGAPSMLLAFGETAVQRLRQSRLPGAFFLGSNRTWSQAQLLHDMLHNHPTWPFGTSELTNTDYADVWDAPDPDDGCVGPDNPGVGPWTAEFDD
jgi:hypothetical protein